MNRLPSWLRSSQDPEQVANKVRGVLLMFSGIIVYLLGAMFGIDISNPQDTLEFVTQISSIAGAVWAAYGVVLNFVTWIFAKRA